jgi:hypothetical protein
MRLESIKGYKQARKVATATMSSEKNPKPNTNSC